MKKTTKTKPPYNIQTQVRSALRKLWLWSPMRSEAMSKARVSRGLYKCSACKSEVDRHTIKIDHTIPVTPVTGFDSWDEFINRLFCPSSGLKAMCILCHSLKTKEENSQRKKSRSRNT